MKGTIKSNEVITKLQEMNLPEKYFNDIMDLFNSIKVDIESSFELEADKVSIKLVNNKGELSKTPLTGMFECNIEGIDPMMIRSVTIPKLDHSDCNVFTLQLEVYPFYKEFVDILDKFRKK
jgi:hypothetical protein